MFLMGVFQFALHPVSDSEAFVMFVAKVSVCVVVF